MEDDSFQHLKTLIETLTHSGLNTLDEEIFRQVKKICKSSQERIPHTYDLVKKQLSKNNSQIRLSAFQICSELFRRSAVFRESVIRDLSSITELIFETNTSKKLPPPKSAADILKQLAVSTLKSWTEEYGETYKKLKVAYNYLEKCKNVNFENFEIGNSAQQLLECENQRHVRLVNEEKMKKVLDEFNSNKGEIKLAITTLSNCLCLLLPPVEEFFIPDYNLEKTECQPEKISHNVNADCKIKNANDLNKNEFDESDNYLPPNNDLREFGISSNYSLPIQLDLSHQFKVTKTEENCAIIENAKDSVRLMTGKFLPMVKKWIKIYCKCSDRGGSDIKKMIDLKENLEKILKKYSLLGITEDSSIIDDSSSCDEFEEVKKEGYEESVNDPEYNFLDCLKNTTAVSSSSTRLIEEPVPSTSKCNSTEKKTSVSDPEALDRKSKLLRVAPKLPYDIDLYHWEDETLSAPTLLSTRVDVDKFWGSAGTDDLHEIPHPDGVAALRTRVIEFSGTFEPVKWACRAPLANGKLCPRKDRYKCPFHGKIVARDEMGNIQNKEEVKEDKDVNGTTAEGPSTAPDWQDPEFLKDLQASTGIDLKMPEKRGKKRRSENKNLTHKKMRTTAAALKLMQGKRFPGLVDVVKKQNSAYARLKKKIFNRASLKRVSAVLDKLDRRKFRDKFADQFNYS